MCVHFLHMLIYSVTVLVYVYVPRLQYLICTVLFWKLAMLNKKIGVQAFLRELYVYVEHIV